MFCPNHLVIGKMENMTLAEGWVGFEEETELPVMPIMKNVSIQIKSTKPFARVREKMRIDEPLDMIVNQEYIKFEDLCQDFSDVTDKYAESADYIFPEEQFLVKYGLPGNQISWCNVYHTAKHKLMYDLGSLDLQWKQAADFLRQFCIEQGKIKQIVILNK